MKYILFLFGILTLSSCAQIVQPTGGDRDEEPPVLDTLASTPNFQTNFEKKELVFEYNEWLQLKDVFNQVVISPPLRYQPEVITKKKSVRFRFDEREELKENATYVINFGDAVQDFTEGNPTELRYVFSTGDFIDSLSVGGRVVDAFTGEAVPEVLVMLYDNLADSVVRTERPFYFSKTDEQGNFSIKNLRADTFKLFALEDSGLDYLYTKDGERIGFSDSLIVVADSLQPKNLTLSFFAATPELSLQDDIQDKYGVVRLSFNREPYDVEINYPDFGQKVIQEVKEDSLLLWYDDPSGGDWEIYVGAGDYVDTIAVAGFSKPEFLEKDTFFLENKKFGIQKVNPKKTARLTFNHPLDSIDFEKISFTEDTLKTVLSPDFSLDPEVQRTLVLTYKWKEDMSYELVFLPGALRDLYGLSNTDTISIDYKTTELKEFGNIFLTVDSLQAEKNYVFELMLKDEVIETLTASGQDTYKHDFFALPPGNYSLRITEDTDGNERWSPGDYDLKIQSERVFEKTIEELRANWEVEAIIAIE